MWTERELCKAKGDANLDSMGASAHSSQDSTSNDLQEELDNPVTPTNTSFAPTPSLEIPHDNMPRQDSSTLFVQSSGSDDAHGRPWEIVPAANSPTTNQTPTPTEENCISPKALSDRIDATMPIASQVNREVIAASTLEHKDIALRDRAPKSSTTPVANVTGSAITSSSRVIRRCLWVSVRRHSLPREQLRHKVNRIFLTRKRSDERAEGPEHHIKRRRVES